MSKTHRKAASGGVVAGRRPVFELLRAGRRNVESVAVAAGSHLPDDLARLIRKAGVPVEEVPSKELARIAGISAHQGVVARADPLPLADVRTLVDDARFVVALDGVEDPRNLGAILRVAEAAGADGVLTSTRKSAPLSPAALKAAAGAADWLDIALVPNLANALELAKRAGMWVVGLESSGEPVGDCALLDERVVLVAGSEKGGLRRRTAECCDAVCSIPMLGEVGSLNVSAAVAVAAYRVAEKHSIAPDQRRAGD